jgi:hypothetical protein
MPVVAGAVLACIERDFGDGRVVVAVWKNDERDGGSMPAQQGEVRTIGCGAGPEREWAAATGAERWHTEDPESPRRGTRIPIRPRGIQATSVLFALGLARVVRQTRVVRVAGTFHVP